MFARKPIAVNLLPVLLLLWLVACSGSKQVRQEEQSSEPTAAAAVTGDAAEPYQLSAGDQAHPTVSADGNLLAYQSNVDGNWEIYLQSTGGSTPVRLTDDIGSDEDPAFSPTADRLLFTWSPPSVDGGEQRDIYLINRDGSNRRAVIQSPADDWAPVFLADGSGFLFLSDRADETALPADRHRTLYRYSFADQAVSSLFNDGQYTGSAYDARSNQWLLTSHEGWFRADSTLSNLTILQTPQQLLVQAGVIPVPGSTSLAVCFGEGVEDVRRLYLLNLDTGVASPLTASALDARWPAITPDGSLIYFCARTAADPSAVFDLYRVALPLTGRTL